MVDICCILQLSARDVSAQTSRKSAAKCDKHCELQNSVSHENLERTLRFRDIPESMPASLSIHFSYLRAHPWVACRCSRVLVGCGRFICLAIQHMHSSSDRRLSGRRCWLAHVCFQRLGVWLADRLRFHKYVGVVRLAASRSSDRIVAPRREVRSANPLNLSI